MNIVGIDPSLSATGVCVISDSTDRVKLTEIGSKPGGNVVNYRIGRFSKLVDNILEYLGENMVGSPAGIIIEDYAFAQRSQSTHVLAEFGGILRYRLVEKFPAAHWVEVGIGQLKKFGCGDGKASKPDVVEGVKRIYPHVARQIMSDNKADAFVLAQIGGILFELCQPETPAQCDVMRSLSPSRDFTPKDQKRLF